MARSDKSVAKPFIWLEDKEWKYVVGDAWFKPEDESDISVKKFVM